MPHYILSKKILCFLFFGSLAATIHLTATYLLVSFCKIYPLWANVLGFLAAFCASFLGHYFFTFRGTTRKPLSALSRYFLTAFFSFILNQGLFFYFFQIAGYHYLLALTGTLLLVAIITYILTQTWAMPCKKTL